MNINISNILKYLALVFIVVLGQSCEEGFDDFVANPIQGDINTFAAVAPKVVPEVFTFSTTKENELVTKNNILITIPKEDIFRSKRGEIIKKDIELQLSSLDNQAMFIFNQLENINRDNELLRSISIIEYRFMHKEEELSIKKDSKERIKVSVPARKKIEKDIKLYALDASNDNKNNWVALEILLEENKDSTEIFSDEGTISINDTLRTIPSYVYEIVQPGVINIANVFSKGKETISTCIHLESLVYNDSNTIAFLYYPKINSSIVLSYDETSKLFCDTKQLGIVGEKAVLGVISNQGTDEYHFDYAEIIIGEDLDNNSTLFPIKMPIKEIISIINDF